MRDMTRLADPKNLLLNLGHSLETNLDSEIASSYHDDNYFSAHCHKANEFGIHPMSSTLLDLSNRALVTGGSRARQGDGQSGRSHFASGVTQCLLKLT
jgi:hypothetical protein